jgi:hypothetical protein
MRTMDQQLACSFRCARLTLHGFIELIRASLAFEQPSVSKKYGSGGSAIMKSLFAILIILPGLIGLPAVADISSAACEDIIAAEPAPQLAPKPDEEEPDCE